MKRLIIIILIVAIGLVAFAGVRSLRAQTGNQWLVNYYNNPDWAGNPVFTQFSPYLNFNWGTNPPAPNMPADNWTARMVTDAFFYAGFYRFTLLADDEAVLTVDNVVYLDTRGKGQSGKTLVIDIPMTQNYHRLQVDFREYTGAAYLSVNWIYVKPISGYPTPPPPGPTPTPPQCPAPPSATSVTTKYGDYTPCIQQGLHQSKCYQSNGAWDAPNMGSIETEPPIVIWGNCKTDEVSTMQLYACEDPQSAKCSKTEAGWFPN